MDFVKVHKKYKNTLPILTPRFIPSCTDELLDMLKMVQMRYQIPVQSHLSENLSEIEWVKELCPYAEFYGDAYDHFGLFGADAPTVMAHCVYSTEEEIQRMKELIPQLRQAAKAYYQESREIMSNFEYDKLYD